MASTADNIRKIRNASTIELAHLKDAKGFYAVIDPSNPNLETLHNWESAFHQIIRGVEQWKEDWNDEDVVFNVGSMSYKIEEDGYFSDSSTESFQEVYETHYKPETERIQRDLLRRAKAIVGGTIPGAAGHVGPYVALIKRMRKAGGVTPPKPSKPETASGFDPMTVGLVATGLLGVAGLVYMMRGAR